MASRAGGLMLPTRGDRRQVSRLEGAIAAGEGSLGGHLRLVGAQRASSSPPAGLANTAMHPFRQLGNTLFADKGTSTWLLRGLTAKECAVPAGKTFALPAVLMVGVTCNSRWRLASMTPSTGPPD